MHPALSASKSPRRRRAEKCLKWLNPDEEIYNQELSRIEETQPSPAKMSADGTQSSDTRRLLDLYLKVGLLDLF